MNHSVSKYFHTALKFDRALLTLLEKKAFEYITVSELCKEAGVNRSTFYLHYENTRDLLNETTRYVLDDFVQKFPMDSRDIAGRFRDCDLKELVFINSKYLNPYLSYVREHRKLFMAVIAQPGVFRFDVAYHRLFEQVFNPVLDRFQYPVEGRHYAMMFYLNGITAIVTEWIQDDCAKSLDEISSIMQRCIFGLFEPEGGNEYAGKM